MAAWSESVWCRHGTTVSDNMRSTVAIGAAETWITVPSVTSDNERSELRRDHWTSPIRCASSSPDERPGDSVRGVRRFVDRAPRESTTCTRLLLAAGLIQLDNERTPLTLRTKKRCRRVNARTTGRDQRSSDGSFSDGSMISESEVSEPLGISRIRRAKHFSAWNTTERLGLPKRCPVPFDWRKTCVMCWRRGCWLSLGDLDYRCSNRREPLVETLRLLAAG